MTKPTTPAERERAEIKRRMATLNTRHRPNFNVELAPASRDAKPAKVAGGAFRTAP